MTLTLKMRTLKAMRVLGKCTAHQIASHLQHDLQKTRALIADVQQHNLARNVGMLDGYTAYELTSAGSVALTKALNTEDQVAEEAQRDRSASSDTEAEAAQPAEISKAPTPDAPAPSPCSDIEIPRFREDSTYRIEARPLPRFGLLNTRELMILVPGQDPLILPAQLTAELSELLSRRIV